MRRTPLHFYLCLTLFGALLLHTDRARAEDPEDIVVIVHKSVAKKEVTIAELQDYFLKNRLSWPDGQKVVPINVKEDTPLRDAFRRRVLGMTATQENRYWLDRKIQSGHKKPPELGNTVKAVYRIKGAIGYTYRKNYKEGVVTIVFVLPKE